MKTPYTSKSVPSHFDSALDAASGHIVDHVDASSLKEKARHLESAIAAIRPIAQCLAIGKLVKVYRDKGMALQESEDLVQEAILKIFSDSLLRKCASTIAEDRSQGLKVSGDGSRLNGLLRTVVEWRVIDSIRKDKERLGDLAHNHGIDVESVQVAAAAPELNSKVAARARLVMKIEEEFLTKRKYNGKPVITYLGDWRLTKEMAGLITAKSRPPISSIPLRTLQNINKALVQRIHDRMGPGL